MVTEEAQRFHTAHQQCSAKLETEHSRVQLIVHPAEAFPALAEL
jgi:hypothetical protein